MLRWVMSLVVTACLCAAWRGSPAAAAVPRTGVPAASAQLVERQAADWIASSCVAPGGALLVRPRGSLISGYFGNLTAAGLVAARMHLDVALGWMRWYVANARGSGSGVDGVPDDATIEPRGLLRSLGRPDSTDAYGATFLSLTYAAYQIGDPAMRAFIADHRGDLRRIALSIVATQQPNGLTWSRPQHHIAYAIDNEQVYRGLLDGVKLMREAYHDAYMANRLHAYAVATHAGLWHTLWDPGTQTFRPYVGASGTGPQADLSRAYPDALAQVLAIVYGVVDPSSPLASALLARAAPALSDPNRGDVVEYRYAIAYAKRRMGSDVAGQLAFTDPPLCADAGWLLQVEALPPP